LSETFALEWLRLREPVDHRSRAVGLIEPLQKWWRARGAARVLDLGSGLGSNVRYLAPRLPGPQRWTLVDQDAGLLSLAPKAGDAAVPGVESIQRVRGDLAEEGLRAVEGADLVTASALLDLVSQEWLDALVATCARRKCAALFALSWDGTISWGSGAARSDADPEDALVLDAVRAHQRRDKGLGPALGPTAGAAVEHAFRRTGFRTWTAASPWVLGPADAELARQLVDGCVTPAVELMPEMAHRIYSWAERRRAAVEVGAFQLNVGHLDVLALPDERLVDWLTSSPAKGFFVPIESESTDDL
jgi:hypothetical protein